LDNERQNSRKKRETSLKKKRLTEEGLERNVTKKIGHQ